MPQKKNKQLKRNTMFAVLLCGGLLFSFSVTADEKSIVGMSKNKLEDQYEALTAQIRAAKQILAVKQQQGSALADQVQVLEAQARKIELEIDLNKKKLNDLKGEIDTLSGRIAEKTELMNNQKKIISELLRSYYIDRSFGDLIPLIYSSQEAFAFFRNGEATLDTSEKTRELLASVKLLRDSLISEKQNLDTKKKEADELQLQLSERNDYLESTKSNKAALLTKTQQEVNKYDKLIDDLQKQREEIEEEIEELEAGKIDQLTGMPSFKKGLFSYPLKKFTVSQGYGKTSFSKNYASGKHNGIDFAAPTGTSIYAPLGGKVVGTGNLGKYAYGKWVTIDHGNGLVTLYGHMNSISVDKGEKVKEGDKIGTVGNTGYSTGAHLHFTVFSEDSYEVVPSKSIKGLKIPIGATVNPKVYLP